MKAKVACSIVVAILLLGADEPKEVVKKEVAKLQGTWVPTSLNYNGKDMTNDGKVKFKLVFKGDQATLEGAAAVQKEYGKITFKLDPETTPKCVDLVISAGSQKDAVLEGIYELKDDELKSCAKVLGKERPAEFSSPEGSSIVLLVLKKEKQ